MQLPELEKYQREKRKRDFERYGGKPRFLKLHNILHMPLVLCLKIRRKFSGVSLILCSDERVKTDRPVIYACTHCGGVDIETAFEAIRKPCWLFLGDPREAYKSIDGLMLSLNGVICLETRDKEDRCIAKETAIQLLHHGGNLLIFPEGAWNITENKPVMGLFLGTVDMAIRCNADIVPIAIERKGKDMYVAIGRNLHFDSDTNTKEANTVLRDILATLKWQVWEKIGIYKRADIPPDHSEQYIHDLFDVGINYTIKDALCGMYNDLNITEYDKAFEHLDNIEVNKQTAFLFNKRLK